MGKKGGSEKVLTGYKYYLSWAIGLCMGKVDALLCVLANDEVVWSGELYCPETGGKETIAIEDMGTMYFYFGTDDHEPIPEMDNLCYKGLCFAWFDDCYVGTTNNPPIMSFIVRRYPSCSFDPGDTYRDITIDYNPVHAMWHTLRYHANFPVEWLDEASFLTAAETVYNELLGIQSMISTSQTVISYLEQVATHINALLSYKSDGKIHAILLRNDYDVDTLPVIDQSVLISPPVLSRKAWIDTLNEVRAKYSQRYFSPENIQIVYLCFIDEASPNYYPDVTDFWTNDLALAIARKESVEAEDMTFSSVVFKVNHGDESELYGIYPLSEEFPSDLALYKELNTTYTYIEGNSYTDEPGYWKWVMSDSSIILDGFTEVVDPNAGKLYVVSTVDVSGSMSTVMLEPHYSRTLSIIEDAYPDCIIVEHIESRGDERWLNWISEDVSDVMEDIEQGYNYRAAIASPISIDTCNKDIQGMTSSQTIELPLFTTNRAALWAGDEVLRELSNPYANAELTVNRDAFLLEPGDYFLFSYPNYGIYNAVYRVTTIEERDLSDESIAIIAQEVAGGVFVAPGSSDEEIDAIVSSFEPVPPAIIPEDEYIEPTQYNVTKTSEIISVLPRLSIIEVPYINDDTTLYLKPLCGRYTQFEMGYVIFISVDDGVSYSELMTVNRFNVYGTITEDYTDDTYAIDDEIGFYVEFANSDFNMIESVSMGEVLNGSNSALLGNEFISFKVITPISETVCHITGVVRGRMDTIKEYHYAGEEFYFIGLDTTQFTHPSIMTGETLMFKYVPFGTVRSGNVASAYGTEITIEGRSRKPYMPWNLLANNSGINATYVDDVVLTWDARIRDLNTVNFESILTPTHEGYFEIEIYVDDTLVRTETDIDAVSWTYTEAMNLSDNTTLADAIEFRILNFKEFTDGIRYDSDQITVTVKKE